jgi:hypothetical protein
MDGNTQETRRKWMEHGWENGWNWLKLEWFSLGNFLGEVDYRCLHPSRGNCRAQFPPSIFGGKRTKPIEQTKITPFAKTSPWRVTGTIISERVA